MRRKYCPSGCRDGKDKIELDICDCPNCGELYCSYCEWHESDEE